MKDVLVTLNGHFSVIDRHGIDLTPNGNRARALLAILILSPETKRARLDLQTLLWGNVDIKTGQVRLRQCLTEIRSKLRKSQTNAVQLLEANHTFTWLNTDIIGVDPRDIENHGDPLLSNIRVPTTEYQQWLKARTGERSATDPLTQDEFRPHSAEPRTLWIHTDTDKSQGLFADNFKTQLIRNITDQTPVRCIEQHDGSTLEKSHTDLLLQIVPFTSSYIPSFSLTLKSVGARDILWRHLLPTPDQSTESHESRDIIHRAAQAAADNILKALRRSARSTNDNVVADQLAGRALRRLLTFIPEKIIESKMLLRQAQKRRPHPTQLAWLCTVIMIESIELPTRQTPADLALYREYADTALSEAPDNAFVLALLSQVRLMVDGDLGSARAMAQEALRINPGLAIAHIANALCDKHCGEVDHAMALANQGLAIGVDSPMRYWWLMILSVTQIRAGLYEEAIVSANKALLGAPSFKAPMRHLYALYLHTDQTQHAANMLSRLHRLEPGFSLEYVRANPDYPAQTLRESPLINNADVDPQDI